MELKVTLKISAKDGKNVQMLLEQTIEKIPPPISEEEQLKASKQPLKAFLFDARFVQSRGVSCLIKIMSGTLNLQ